MTDREMAQALALGRAAVGATFVLFPRRATAAWLGEIGDVPAAKLLGRSLGSRDLVLGLGVLFALEEETPVRGWLEAAAAADAVDAVATLLSMKRIPKLRGLITIATALGASVIGFGLASRLD